LKRHWKTYLLSFIILLLIEVCIALFVDDTIIRPFVGDMLVVLLVYCFVMTLLTAAEKQRNIYVVSLYVLIFAFCIEGLQATSALQWLGLSQNRFASIVLGNTFDWWDLVAYTCGTLLLLLIEHTTLKL
jgi:hypothetical protein